MKIYNRRAKFKYFLLDTFEAGIVLTGAEIKSIRAGRADLSESFARINGGELFLVNAFINPWMGSEKYNNSRRERKLLLHKKQILSILGKLAKGNFTLVPVSIYIKGNLAKAEIALAKSKAKYDRRADIKKRTIDRDVDRAIRGEK